jgi:lantibiotic biosynthesis protein
VTEDSEVRDEAPLDPRNQTRARQWAIELADGLASGHRELHDPSLAGGSAGLAILFAAVHARTADRGWAQAADDAMARAAVGVAEQIRACGVGFYAGLAGVAWSELVVDALLGREQAVNRDVTEVLQVVVDDDDAWPWELTAGLVGLGVYAQHCVELGAPPLLLTTICERLLRERRDGTWVIDSDLLFGAGQSVRPRHYIDLGMAHGIAGIVALAAVAAAPDGPSVADELLSRSVAALSTGEATVAVDGDQHRSSLPPRWCYGDVGIAVALTLAHQRKPDDVNLGLLASRTRDRVTAAPTRGVAELGICHGLAGVALVLRRLAHLTGELRCVEACRLWSGLLLDRLDAVGTAGGVLDAADAGVLEGVAGIALTLLSLADPQPSNWERMLLLQ